MVFKGLDESVGQRGREFKPIESLDMLAVIPEKDIVHTRFDTSLASSLSAETSSLLP